ncbi:VOC family protein [Ekhidna sp.]
MKLFSHASSIFPVADPLVTAEYYRDVLGFAISFKWEDPPSYVIVSREEAISIHFAKSDHNLINSNHSKLYIFVHDADAVYQEYLDSGANIIEPINDTDYQMREFVIQDLNGYQLIIGKGIS